MKTFAAHAVLCLAFSACTAGSSVEALEVFAASSLTEAFGALEEHFEQNHPGVDVRTTHAGSQILRVQIENGARAHVFASADHRHLDAMHQAGTTEAPQRFATNRLVVVVPRENPAGIEYFEELPRAERIVLGTGGVPIGRYARAVLERAGDDFWQRVRERVVSEENNVRLVRAKVELGEADAAIVYRSDTMDQEAIRAIPIPDRLDARAEYAASVVAHLDPGARARAQEWMALLGSNTGRDILARHGFEPPP